MWGIRTRRNVCSQLQGNDLTNGKREGSLRKEWLWITWNLPPTHALDVYKHAAPLISRFNRFIALVRVVQTTGHV